MPKYRVTLTATAKQRGYLIVEADSKEDAMSDAEYAAKFDPTTDIEWELVSWGISPEAYTAHEVEEHA